MCTSNSLARPLSYPRCSHNLLVIFLLLEAWWLGHIWRFPMFHKKTLNFPILLKQGCILQVNTVQYLYLQIVYLFEIIDEHCICFNVLVMAFGVFFESFFWQNFRCLFWTDGLMQWHFEDTAKHQSQEGWMACISYDALLLSLYQFSVMCFPLSDLSFPSIGKWWINATLQFVNIICSSSRHLASSKIANNLKSCYWYLLMNNHWYKATDFLICLFLP